jgi:hypothetical protein
VKKGQWILGAIVLIAVVALAFWARTHVHFDFSIFRAQLTQADWHKIILALACIYVAFIFRAFRWSQLIRHTQKVQPFSLVGTQVIGFTAVALIGRMADPVRPYLVAKKTGLPVSSQIAVYIVERLLDAGSMGLIFSVAMFWIPGDEVLKAMSHSATLAKLEPHHHDLALFIARYGGIVLTVLGTLFLVVVRLAGGTVASFCERSFGLISKSLGQSIAHKIRVFHSGLDTIHSFSDFAAVAGQSLGMWLLIAFAYFQTCTAFVASPELATLTPPKCILLMLASGGASIFQLPILGWFSQIGWVAVVITGVLHATPEAATACAATLLLVTFLGVVPIGLIWAQFDHVSLRKVARESEHANEGADPADADPTPIP